MSKVTGIVVNFWHFFTMPALQILSCHVTQEANFKKNLFFLNSAFNIRKGYKIISRKALYFRSYQPKTSRGGGGGWKTPPSAFRVKQDAFHHVKIIICAAKHHGCGMRFIRRYGHRVVTFMEDRTVFAIRLVCSHPSI